MKFILSEMAMFVISLPKPKCRIVLFCELAVSAVKVNPPAGAVWYGAEDPPPPPPPDDATVHVELVGVTVTVIVPVPDNIRVDSLDVQSVLWVNAPELGLGLSVKIRRSDETTVILDPNSNPMSKLSELTTIEAMVAALDPDIVRLIPATLMTTSVVSVTSSDAAKLRDGTASSANSNVSKNFCIVNHRYANTN